MTTEQKIQPHENHPFATDRAISKIEEDQLNRSHFADQLASSLSSWSGNDSLVVAIYGKWGDGKTSVKNMLAQCLQKNSNNCIEILEFNPWQWSHSNNLADSFFRELRSILLKDKDQNRNLIKKWERYSAYLNVARDFLSPIVDNIKTIVQLASFIFIIFGFWNYTAIVIGLILFAAGNSVKFLSWIAELYLRFKKIDQKSESLEDIKKELSRELESSQKTFLIVVDDIDRLNPDEVKDIFTLIKANADFPKMIYLTLFQRDIVEKSLETNGIFSGHDYLEKIIQVGIDLPGTPPDGIHHILFKKLDELLEKYADSQSFDQGRWRQLFNEGIGYYFKNLRDVNRFISSLSFQLGALYKNNELDVNFIDLVGIEVLRLHETEVYKTLFENKDVMTESSSSGLRARSNDEKKEQILNVIKKAVAGNDDYVKQIIEVLFPNTKYAWSNYHANVSNENFVNRQICHPDRFNRYFSFFMAEGDFSEHEYQEFLQSTADYEKLMALFNGYYQSGRLSAFVGKLEFYKQMVPAENAHAFLTAIFALGDMVSDEYKGAFHTSPFTTLNRVVTWYLKKKEFNNTRSEIFKKAVKETVGFTLPIQDLHDEWERRNEAQYPEIYSLKAEDKEDAKNLLLEKVQAVKDADAFRNSPQIFRLLWTWQKFEPNEVTKWLDENLKSDEFFVHFCNRLMNKSFTSSGYNTKTHHYLSTDSLNTLFSDPKQIVARLMILRPKFNDLPHYKNLFGALNKAMEILNDPEKFKNRFNMYDDDLDED